MMETWFQEMDVAQRVKLRLHLLAHQLRTNYQFVHRFVETDWFIRLNYVMMASN